MERRKLPEGLFIPPNTRYIHMRYKHPITGKRLRESTKTTEPIKAKQLRDIRIAAAWDKKYLNKAEAMTANQLLDWAKENIWQNASRPRQLEFAIKRVRDFFGEKMADTVLEEEIFQFISSIKKQNLSAATAIRPLTYLAAAYRAAIHCKKLLVNPVANARGLRPDLFNENSNRRLIFLEPNEVELLLSELQGELELIVRFALRTGMRQGEILRTEWQDIDLRNLQIRTWSEKGRMKKKKERFIPILPDVLDIIKSLPKYGSTIFAYPDGRPLSSNGVVHSTYQRATKRLAKQNPKFADFTFHDLRHTFASSYLNMGGDINALKDILGHSSTEMTERYGHLSKKKLFVEMNLLPRLPVISGHILGIENKVTEAETTKVS